MNNKIAVVLQNCYADLFDEQGYPRKEPEGFIKRAETSEKNIGYIVKILSIVLSSNEISIETKLFIENAGFSIKAVNEEVNRLVGLKSSRVLSRSKPYGYNYTLGKVDIRYDMPVINSVESADDYKLNLENTAYDSLGSDMKTFVTNHFDIPDFDKGYGWTADYTNAVFHNYESGLYKYKINANVVYKSTKSHLKQDWHRPIQTANRVGEEDWDKSPIIQAYGPANITIREKWTAAGSETNGYNIGIPTQSYDLTDMNKALREFRDGPDFATFLALANANPYSRYWYLVSLNYMQDDTLSVTYKTKPIGWEEHIASYPDSPVVEITDASELRIYGGATIKAETQYGETVVTFGGTENEGEVSFTIDELKNLKTLLTPENFMVLDSLLPIAFPSEALYELPIPSESDVLPVTQQGVYSINSVGIDSTPFIINALQDLSANGQSLVHNDLNDSAITIQQRAGLSHDLTGLEEWTVKIHIKKATLPYNTSNRGYDIFNSNNYHMHAYTYSYYENYFDIVLQDHVRNPLVYQNSFGFILAGDDLDRIRLNLPQSVGTLQWFNNEGNGRTILLGKKNNYYYIQIDNEIIARQMITTGLEIEEISLGTFQDRIDIFGNDYTSAAIAFDEFKIYDRFLLKPKY